MVLDIIHVIEYVWKAAHVFHRERSPDLEYWVWTRVQRILEGKASKVAAAMRRAATVAGLANDTRKPVDTCADYLLKYAPYLHYDRYLAAGYPIATGVIEGACRYLVRDRMELTGARWRLVGAEAVLKLRALRASGDFDAYWDFHDAREYERNHAQRYADGKAPPVTEPSLAALSTTPSTGQVALPCRSQTPPGPSTKKSHTLLRNEGAAKAKRTLTNLYNTWAQWLADAHAALALPWRRRTVGPRTSVQWPAAFRGQ